MKREYRIPIMLSDETYKQAFILDGKKNPNKVIGAEEVKTIIDSYLNIDTQEEKQIEVVFLGGNFTGLEIDKQEELLQAVYTFIEKKKLQSVCFSSRPDTIDKKQLKLYKKYKVKTIELTAISTNPYLLEKSQVGYTWEMIKKASKWIKFYGMYVGYQIMVGLPESTRLDERNTALSLLKLKPNMVRIYPVLVEKGSRLEELYKTEEYIPFSLTQAVERCKEIANLFNIHKVPIIKIGEEGIDEKIRTKLNSNYSIIAGPYHPEFRQLVEGAMWYDAVVERIKKINTKVKQVEIKANEQDIPNMIGYQKENVKKLKEIYDVDVVITPEENMKQGRFEVLVEKTYDEIIEEEREKRQKTSSGIE